MDYHRALEYAGLTELPKSYEQRWDTFLALPERALWDDDYLLRHQNLFGFCDELTGEILRVASQIKADDTLRLLARFFHWVIFVDSKPFLAEKPYTLQPERMGAADKGLFAMVVLIEETRRTLDAIQTYHLDFANITGHFKSLHHFAKEYHQQHGNWGLLSFAWNCSCVVPYMNRCGHLGFEPVSIEYDYTFYLHNETGAPVVLCGDGIPCAADGLLTNSHCPESFRTTVRRGDGWIEGHRVAPLGYIERSPVRLAADAYTPVIRQWDILLAFHIPEGPGYTVENCRQSFYKAVEFYHKTFPGIDFKGIWCYSWLFSPQLRLLFEPGESEMVTIQRYGYQVPAWRDSGAYNRFVFKVDGKLDEIALPQKSRLHRRLAAVIHRGGQLTSGGLMIPLALLDKWGERQYDDRESLAVFRAMQPYQTDDLTTL